MGYWRDFIDRYTIRAPLSELQDRAENTEMRRTLGAGSLAAFGVGAIVGAGIFAVVGPAAAHHAGPSIAISFALAALVSGLVALAYAELATLIPLGGSAYTYASAGLGEFVGWLVAWSLVVSYAVGNAAVATSFSDNVAGLLTNLGLELPWAWTNAAGDTHPVTGAVGVFDVPAFLVVALITLILLRPTKESSTWNLILVGMKVGVLVLFVALGSSGIESVNYDPFFANGTAGVLAGAGLVFFAFLGFDAISTAAEETRNPQRNLPLGILGCLVIVTLLYVVVALVLTGLVPSSQLDTGEALAFALRESGYSAWVSGVLNIGGLAATLSVLLVFQLATTRVFLAISRDGLFPRWLAKVSPRQGTPNRVTLVLGLLVGLGSAVFPLGPLVALTNEATLFFFGIVCLAVIALRRSNPDAPRPFKVPGYPWVPLAGAAACAGFMATLGWDVHLGFAAWMGLGIMIYAAYGARNSVLRRRISEGGVAAREEDAAAVAPRSR